MRVKLLGPIQVEDADGTAVAVAGTKQRAVLAILALNAARPVPVETLVDAVWGSESALDARNTLQHQVSRLRKALGREAVTSQGPTYVLNISPEDVDAVRFERLATEGRAELRLGDIRAASAVLRRAEQLWRGPALEEFDRDWARADAVRLEQLRLDVLEDRVDADLRLGHHREVVGELESSVREHPYRERLWAHLMVALYRCGRQADALAAFQQARALLAEELGIEPGPELRELEAAVLRHDPELNWSPVDGSPALATPVVQGRLPIPLTSFVGRETQLTQVRRAVGEHRLVTLTGAAGSGKTRLAIEAASALRDDFADGAWMVELEPLADAAAVPQAIASALAGGTAGRLSASADEGPASAGAGLLEYLRPRQLLLVVDNCEHLLSSVTEWAQLVLSACPRLHLLATSREPLGIVGEIHWLVPPLTVPAADVDDPATLAATESVRLFEDRARRVSAFELTADNTATVADLCRHLDGLPLAIELAAARTKALPVTYIATELSNRFTLLVSPGRTSLARHHSLRATIDWSYDLLDERERTLFDLLSVFEGGCSIEAAMALARVGGIDPAGTLDLLSLLVDKSLVVPQGAGQLSGRYDMLETVRFYGREQLQVAGLLTEARRAHRNYFVALAEDAEAGLMSKDYRTWQIRLESEFGNLQAAHQSAISSGAFEDSLRIAGALWWFWSGSDRHTVGREWIDAALRGSTGHVRPSLRARALTVVCYLAGQQFDLENAVAAGEQALALTTESMDAWSTAWSKQSIGLTLEVAGDHQRATVLLAEARAVMDAKGDHWYVAANDLVTCVRALRTGDLDELDKASHEVLSRAALIGYEPFRCWAYLLCSRVAELRGDVATARAEAERAVLTARHTQLNHYVAFALVQLGRTALLDGDQAAAEGACREAIMAAEAGGAGWFAALARVGLAGALRSKVDHQGAASLLHEVVAWGERATTGGRQFFFLALGGDPRVLAAEALENLTR
ncbi:BTAD domain-containing putative transcriptional regulator [Kribbella qitaiheensis]|uniref:BTAD domain-containing putative transcriptional regulator n=1 Tax=Kribbella qitaiheensis TaxID=1544730 RepID=UPI00361339DF